MAFQITTFMTEYTGDVPNRQNDTPIAFADNVYNYQLWINNNFSMEINPIICEMNSLADSIDVVAKTVEQDALQVSINSTATTTAKNEAISAKDEAVLANNKIQGYVIPSEATYNAEKIDRIVGNFFTAYGYTKRVSKADRWLETDTPNVIVDKVGDSVRFSDGLVERTTNEQLTLPNAPFAPTSTDELLDYSVNSVTTKTDHSTGDIVVCGNGGELADAGIATDPQYTIVSETEVHYVDDNGELTTIAVVDSLVSGVSYLLKFTLSNYSDDSHQDCGFLGGGLSVGARLKSNGEHSEIFVATGASISCFGRAGQTADFEFSVKAIEQTYQATEPTIAGELVTSSKFQKIDYVTRKDLVLLTKTGYKTVIGIHSFAPQTSNDDIASAYGYSKINSGLYHNGTEEVIIVGLYDRLNAGAYHPVFNSTGDTKFSDNKFWYETTDTHNNLYDTILNRSTDSTVSGRPDSKFYDKAYFGSNGGLIFKPSYAKDYSKTDLLNEKIDLDMGEERGISVQGYACELLDSISAPAVTITLGNTDGIKVGDIVYHQKTDGSYYKLVVFASITATTVACKLADYSDAYFTRTQGNVSIGTKIPNSLLTQGQSLSVDIVGDPAQYISTNTTSALQSTSTDTGTELRAEALSWNVDESKMYKCLNMYQSSDALATLQSTSSDSGTDLRINALVWNAVTNTMYYFVPDETVDNVDMTLEDYTDTARYAIQYRDNVDLTVEDYTITIKWEATQKGYPQSWLDYLALGKSANVNPLLVGENGEDLIPAKAGVTFFKVSNKNVDIVIKATQKDTNDEWIYSTRAFEKIPNTVRYGGVSTGYLYMFQYASQNKPLSQSTPLPIQIVLPKTVASNSHSVYKGAMLTNAITGKVAVGNGARGLEGKVLENSIVDTDGILQTTPKHSTLTLDLEVSPTAKWFTALVVDSNDEYCLQMFGEELIGTTGDNQEFDNLTNGNFIDVNGITAKSYTGIQRLGVYSNEN